MIWLLSCFTDPTTVNIISPTIVITESQVDFGEVKVDESQTFSLSVLNSGAGVLNISAIGTQDFNDIYSFSQETIELNSDELATIDITFSPPAFETYDTILKITSNDVETPELELPILGFGGDGPTPDINLSETFIDFGEVAVGEKATRYFTVRNQGDAPLEIASTLQNGSGAFTLIGDLDGQVLAPSVETAILVEYEPFQGNGDSGSLRISSNDPEDPEVTISLQGNGGGDIGYPVADITCPSSVSSPSELYLSGAGSTDPNGQLLSYQWTVERKPGSSQAQLTTPTDSQTYINVDVAGDYQVNLTVQNQDGTLSPAAECLFYAEPPADIHIELSWDAANADFDLHLSKEEEQLFTFEHDCCWCNPQPTWSTEDQSNPILSTDSSDYTIPEEIDVWLAEDRDYHLNVHYFSDLGAGQSTATIRIYLSGVLVEQYSQEMIHNQMWNVGFIRWTTGYFIDNNNAPQSYEGARSCE